MPNIQTIIQGDNKRKTKRIQTDSNANRTTKNCNGRKAAECPLRGECLVKDIIYRAEVKSDSITESYIGLTTTQFKTRYNNHKHSFKEESKSQATELSKHIWELKKQNKTFDITWNIMCKAQSYSNTTKKCNLCTAEKYFIICKPKLATLNRRSELMNKCRHKNKFFLENVT
jgi:hypothetical protein